MAKRIKLNRFSMFVLLVLVILGLAILLTWAKLSENTAVDTQEAVTPQQKATELTILSVGDVMVHNPQISAQYDSSKDEYSYDNNYQYVKQYIEAADLAICNVETTFAGKPYTGYPMFSAPEALAAALKNAGLDVAITANNHMMDKGADGVQRTLDILQENGLQTVGSRKQESDARYMIIDVKGVKVGIIAYTYETGSGEGSTAINGNFISDKAAAHINSFNFNTLDEDLPKIKESIDGARAAGAEIIVAYYHWGEEYQKSANQHQKNLAQKTADLGADIIFASHPHVLQETAWLTVKGSERKVPVFYSMGNFISNQRSETLNNRFTEQGLIAQVTLTYSKEEGIKAIAMSGMPTWVDKYFSNGKQVYEIVPLDDELDDNEALTTSGHLHRAKQAKEDAHGILAINQQEN